MTDSVAYSLQAQQLVELLEVVSAYADEPSATHGAVERAAEMLEAEVAAVVLDGQVLTSVGFPAGFVPDQELMEVARGKRGFLDVPGAGTCFAYAAELDGPESGHLVLARSGDDGFSVSERNLLRGMARILALTLRMIRTLESLRRGQRLMEQLYGIQRSISRRVPLPEVLEMIVRGAHDLVGGEIAGLWLLDSNEPDTTLLVSTLGLRDDHRKRLWRMPVEEAGAAGQAIRGDQLVIVPGYGSAGAALRELTAEGLHRSMATPVHEDGKVAGSLLVASCGQDRVYSPADQDMLRAFAEHASLALTDAKTLNDMHEAFHDSLTRLASRALFLERLDDGLASAEREASRMALLFIDLDRFKAVNDTLGHAAGDILLIGVAERLRDKLRGGDVAARFGGDEFAVMLRNVGVTQATLIADRIIAALQEPFVIGGRQMLVSASVGIAMCDSGQQDSEELLRQADAAMYQAKRNGHGRVEVFRLGMDEQSPDQQSEADLRRAIDQFAHGA